MTRDVSTCFIDVPGINQRLSKHSSTTTIMLMTRVFCLLTLSGVLAQGPPKSPTIKVSDQKGEKGGSINFSFTVEKADQDLDKSQVHIAKASKDHKFTNARFKVELSGDTSKLTGEASADSLTCDDQSAYIIYYQRIPPPPSQGPPPGSFMLQVEGCAPPDEDTAPGYPTITVSDQKGEKGGSVTFSFTVEKAESPLDKSQVHIDKASKDHKFTNARFTVQLSGDSDKLTGEASADSLTCDDQSGYIIYYQRIPPPPSQGPPPGSFLLQVEGCPPPDGDDGPPAQDPKITVDQQQHTSKGATLTFTFKLETNDKTLTKDKVHMVKASQDHKTSPVRFTLTYEVSSDSKTITGTAVADNVTCDDQSGYLIYYDKLPPPPHHQPRMRFRRQPTPPPGGFMIDVDGCGHY